MPLQTLPAVAEVYAAEQRVVITRTVARTLGLWRRMRDDFDVSYAAIEPDLLAAVTAAQQSLATGAQEYVPAVLADLGSSSAARPVATADPRPLVGRAGDGRPLESLLYGAVTHAKQLVASSGPALAWPEALRQAGQWLSMATMTVLSDTGRQSESLAMGVRPQITGYVRMLNPPSCSRCAILAGRVYRSGTPFLRHPRCDCRHIPASEAVADDLTVNATEYFDSLSRAEQDEVFTAAGAEAIRNGADIGQVVNARRGMRAAQIGGRRVQITTEGTTRRGTARRYLDPSGQQRSRGRVRPRLMPETIRAVATSPEDYLRLLRANGYLRG
ncbi:hypothetical protein [Cellulomonas palmilytica]|uniref:hypothetical protein n=1 Tax=Cellulomonas palmilytica TaxID=2608402 RepID=UPI001F1E943D|nr:hypothetical protein [Cellulomonas palmilytica]UJP39335.1 hypothetical protein F1D97_13460 [Cellulomonas palmilytica]